MNKLNLKEINTEISKYFSSVKQKETSIKKYIKESIERLEETYKKIAELEKTRDELKNKLETKNVSK